jgi:hypothetical protein
VDRAQRSATIEAVNVELTDLQRILGYAGAAASGDEYTELAADILVTPFWTPSFCAALIRAAEATGAFEPNPHDPVPGHEVSLAAISPQLFEAVQNDVGGRLWPRLKRVWPYVDYVGLRDAFVIKYELGGQEELRIHHDVAQVSASIKLNDDYTGAELRFPRQNAGNASVAVGDALVWPSLVTHPHLSTPLRSGTKYSLTIWCEVPNF